LKLKAASHKFETKNNYKKYKPFVLFSHSIKIQNLNNWKNRKQKIEFYIIFLKVINTPNGVDIIVLYLFEDTNGYHIETNNEGS
jgi:hypothetical protein